MATAPSAAPLELSKPLPSEASAEPASLTPPLEPTKPLPEGGSKRCSRSCTHVLVFVPDERGLEGVPYSYVAQDPEAGVRGHRHDRLPCCGLGIGWVLFIAGFFLTIPWYVGAVLLCFYREEKREKPGFIACTVAAVLGTILIIIGAILDALVHY